MYVLKWDRIDSSRTDHGRQIRPENIQLQCGKKMSDARALYNINSITLLPLIQEKQSYSLEVFKLDQLILGNYRNTEIMFVRRKIYPSSCIFSHFISKFYSILTIILLQFAQTMVLFSHWIWTALFIILFCSPSFHFCPNFDRQVPLAAVFSVTYSKNFFKISRR